MKHAMGSLGWVLFLSSCLLSHGCGERRVKPAPEESAAVEPGLPSVDPGIEEPAPERPTAAEPLVENQAEPEIELSGIEVEEEPEDPARPSDEKPGPGERPTASEVTQAILEELAKHGVHLDREKKTIRLDAEVRILADYLEYVLVGRRGACHESLFVTHCKPSALNAGLLALGLAPGRNFFTRPKDPMPSEEDIKSGKERSYELIHPVGPQVYLTVEWDGEEGAVVRHRVEDLVLNLKEERPVERRRWVYFGGREASLYRGEPPVFLADYEQNLISVCYMSPDNHLITIVHEMGLNQHNWWPNAEIMPPRGTPVRFFISLEPLP